MGPIHTYKPFHSKGNYDKTNRKPMDWVANYVTDKGLISKIYKQLLQFHNKKNLTTRSKNGQKTSIDIYPEKRHMTNRHMERCSLSLIVR